MFLHQSTGRSSSTINLSTTPQLYFNLDLSKVSTDGDKAQFQYVLQAVAVFPGGRRVPWCSSCSLVFILFLGDGNSVESLVVPPGSLGAATVVSAGAQPWLNEVRVVGMGTDVLISQTRRTLNGVAGGVRMQQL